VRHSIKEQTARSIVESYRPSLMPLTENISAAVFPLMKVLPAEYCVRRALDDGLIGPDSVIVESSSGTMALGLAVVCRIMGLRLIIVSDYSCSRSLQRRLESLGARVDIVSAPAVTGGYQRARLERLHHICKSVAKCWWVNQYDNPGNGASYQPLAEQLIERSEPIDCLVASVGSGGSACGTAKALRHKFPALHLVGVDTFGSVLFGQPDAPRKLRGLGNSLWPGNLDHTAFDEVHWVSAAESSLATRILHRETTLFRGATSGACWMVAQHWASTHQGARVKCIFPDDGNRYIDSVYDDDYLRKNDLWLPYLPAAPREVAHPLEAGPTWSFLRWDRRSYRQVTGSETEVCCAATFGSS
jgi:S-sulfo-L-cysteine synthase (3-phospho-L-serine-dependent)